MFILTICLFIGFCSATFVIGSFFYITLVKPKSSLNDVYITERNDDILVINIDDNEEGSIN